MSNTGKRKILIPIQPPKPLLPAETHNNALRDAIDRALSTPSKRSAKHWGFIRDDNLEIAFIYEYDEEKKPLSICTLPIEGDISIYSEEIKQSINTFYGDDIAAVEYRNNNFENFRFFTDYVCDTDHYVQLSLKISNLTTGKTAKETKQDTEPCYFFRNDGDYLHDMFYDQYEELIEGYEDLRYRHQKDIEKEVMGEINKRVHGWLQTFKVKGIPIYGQEMKFETAHKVTIDKKLFILDVAFEVKL